MMFQTAIKTPTGDALEEFMLLQGRYSNFVKETLFLRYAPGERCDSDRERLKLWAEQGQGRAFAPSLEQPPVAQAGRYAALYRDGQVSFPFRFDNPIWQKTLEDSFPQILAQFRRVRGRKEETILRNFAVKLLYWIDTYFPKLFTDTAKMNRFPKFACGGQVNLAEYLFLYLLFRLGCDVLYFSPIGAIGIKDPELLALSLAVEGKRSLLSAQNPSPVPDPEPARRAVISMNAIRRPDRHTPPAPSVRVTVPPAASTIEKPRRALEFEELARFASSVVMLKVFDQHDQCFKSGSGVIINDKGYVLTNFHVVSGGRYYGILLEEEPDVFYTDRLVKYHQDYDLAVLQMEKRKRPIPISQNAGGLVRGQKVVAIGSPLGLFNTVSDGIISGFRTVGMVSMVQFTAPVSPGSSGGAVLDLYGDLIGLITGGYGDGQNLNLAVDCQTIRQFVRGLV